MKKILLPLAIGFTLLLLTDTNHNSNLEKKVTTQQTQKELKIKKINHDYSKPELYTFSPDKTAVYINPNQINEDKIQIPGLLYEKSNIPSQSTIPPKTK